jgi:hypothetical protein
MKVYAAGIQSSSRRPVAYFATEELARDHLVELGWRNGEVVEIEINDKLPVQVDQFIIDANEEDVIVRRVWDYQLFSGVDEYGAAWGASLEEVRRLAESG